MIRLLLVEDNRADARLLEEHLRSERDRFALTKVETLQAGIAAAAQQDVILLDLSLPDALGLATLTRMIDAVRHVPIIVLTGTRDDRTAIEAVAAGAQDYLLKDELTAELVLRTIRYAIARKKLQTLELDRAKTAEALAHARFLADVTAAASSSLDVGESMRAVAKLLVPTLGDFCAIDLPRGSAFERVATAGDHEALNEAAGASVVQRASAAQAALLLDTPGTGSLLVTPLLARGRVVAAITCATAPAGRTLGADDRMLAEEVGSRLALAIENARLFADAQRALRGRDELLAIVSHDLRNPLGVVDLALEMIEQNPAALPTALPRAQRAVERMTTLIADLLELSRIDAGTLTVDPAPAPVGELLQDVLEQHRVLCTKKSIALVGDIAPDLGIAQLDKHRISQALGNLLGNAIKFTPARGSIVLAARRGPRHLELEVRDTGAGIPREQLAHVFDRFWQADRRSAQGVGLGLAIVKGIVDAHGGSIDVESDVGAGTRFTIELPA